MTSAARQLTAAESAFFEKLREMVARLNRADTLSVGGLVQEYADRHPERVMVYFEDEVWTFERANREANRLANLFQAEGFRKGDVIAFAMENRPEYLIFLAGLNKLGVVAALINIDQRGPALAHAL